MTSSPDPHQDPPPVLALRGGLGGTLMGLANLVPGISGGTMLLAAGVYPAFISAVAEVSTLRLRPRSIVVLASVGGSATLSIFLLAGPVKGLVVEHRWVMYSLFVGLTLGGLPAVWQLATPVTRHAGYGAAAGLLLMVGLTAARHLPMVGGGGDLSWPGFVLGGVAGASAMILPGVSGGFLLLLLGQYVPILNAIDALKSSIVAGDPQAAIDPALNVALPVGIGLVVGVVAVSNTLRWLLVRYSQATLGVLLGFLLGAVVGLWPFQHSVEPVPGETVIRGRVVTAENLAELEVEDYPTAYFRPSAAQLLAALGLIGLGGATTVLIGRAGSRGRAELA